ncbi:hypothetical protein ACFL2K_04590 [Candidatus Margulisiibacteriota bacterium]
MKVKHKKFISYLLIIAILLILTIPAILLTRFLVADLKLTIFSQNQINFEKEVIEELNQKLGLEVIFASYSDYLADKLGISSGLRVYTEDEDQLEDELIQQAIIIPRLIGTALPYPNPMNLSQDGGQIGYLLSADMDIELQVYNAALYRVYKDNYPSGFQGGRLGYNKIRINEARVGYPLPTGVYFYVLIYNKEIVGKGRFAIVR